MIRQAPIKLALQHPVHRLRQGTRNCVKGKGRGSPVLTFLPVPPADHLLQLSLSIGQRHGHAVYLGLYPHTLAAVYPAFDGLFTAQFGQSGVGYRVLDFSATRPSTP